MIEERSGTLGQLKGFSIMAQLLTSNSAFQRQTASHLSAVDLTPTPAAHTSCSFSINGMSVRVQPAATCIQEVCAKCIVTFQTHEDPLVSLCVTCIFAKIMILKSWFKANTKVKAFTALLHNRQSYSWQLSCYFRAPEKEARLWNEKVDKKNVQAVVWRECCCCSTTVGAACLSTTI